MAPDPLPDSGTGLRKKSYASVVEVMFTTPGLYFLVDLDIVPLVVAESARRYWRRFCPEIEEDAAQLI